jgi:hypothetical protein
MKTKFISNLIKPVNILLFLFILGLAACTDDDDDSVANTPGITPNEEELITAVELEIEDTTTNVVQSVRWSDQDGPGGNAPIIDTIFLEANRFHEVVINFYDESDPNDIEVITIEIANEDDEHLICYTPDPDTSLNILRTDSDGNFEVGIETTWESFASQNASVKIVLKHQPGVKDGSCNPGETDIEVDFPVVIR